MTNNVVPLFGANQRQMANRRLNPEKLRKARRAKALTQTDLARSVGLTRQAISAYEQGTKTPEADTLGLIARELEQPVSYFVAPEREAFGPFSARTFRAFGPATAKRNDQCLVLTEWLAVIAAYLDQIVNFPAAQVPKIDPPVSGDAYSDEELEAAADNVRAAWGLGLGPIGNLTKLIESRGVFVAYLPVSAGDVNAFSYWSGDRPFIITGTEETTAVRRRFDIAHELGHLVLHQGIGEEELEDKETLRRVESEANRFAGAFLLPQRSYPNEVFSTRLSNFIPLKERWKVAISAQIYRCADLGIFTDHQILNLRKQISYNNWRSREPLDREMPVERPQLLNKAAKLVIDSGVVDGPTLLSELNIGEKILSSVLDIAIQDLLPSGSENGPDLTLR